MSGPFGDKPIPRPLLIGVGVMLALVIGLVGVAKVSGYKLGLPPADAVAIDSRDVIFIDQPDGGVLVLEAGSREKIDVLAPGAYGFVRGAMRALAREHRGLERGEDAPFRLTAWNDGRVTLDDLTTQARIELKAYGPTNADAFARLLTVGKPAS
jgi:putative photosynthetic complex assembly protein